MYGSGTVCTNEAKRVAKDRDKVEMDYNELFPWLRVSLIVLVGTDNLLGLVADPRPSCGSTNSSEPVLKIFTHKKVNKQVSF